MSKDYKVVTYIKDDELIIKYFIEACETAFDYGRIIAKVKSNGLYMESYVWDYDSKEFKLNGEWETYELAEQDVEHHFGLEGRVEYDV